jgi:uncharacterized protein (DUF58 family)
MGPEDIKRLKTCKLPLYSKVKPRGLLAGDRESTLLGEGVEFAGVRGFEPGDDMRELDLHTLAQSGDEELIERVVERQLPVYIWAGTSAGLRGGLNLLFAQKPAIATIAAGLLIYAGHNAYSPVGLCTFGREIESFYPARLGAGYCDDLLQRLLEDRHVPMAPEADMARALEYMLERVPGHSLVFLISDFQEPFFEGHFAPLLRPAAHKFDLVPVVICDPLEGQVVLPRPVRISVSDHSGERNDEIYLTPQRLAELQEASARHLAHLAENFRQAGAGHVVLDAPSVAACQRELELFFAARRQARG